MRERWPEIKRLFDEAVELDAAERDAWLVSACDDPALIEEVRSLLRYDASDTGSIGGGTGTGPERRLGAYELREVVGSGGMGEVYRAERADDEFNKEVAIKLIKRGMDSDRILRRFRQERQVLANLEHPGIARLVDGGITETGRPYLVMEYVDGAPIDTWCDQRSLPVQSRLDLFGQVCAAVQHAHRNLVVHGDLKPGNILVTEAGEAKLLDFGIARVLTPDHAGDTLTEPGSRPMTPRYASPEQVRGGVITTSTDVYALGVLLYELLTERRPYEFTTHTRDEIERLVCDTDPPRPSVVTREDDPTLSRRLDGDLDTIVMKAMHKDPARRYGSCEQLADDIRRHLEGLPVLARPDTLTYRASCFVGRHRVSVAAATIAILALVGGVVASTTLWLDARYERIRAQTAEQEATQRFEQVRSFAQTMMYGVHDEVAPLAGSMPARKFIVETTLEYLDGLAAEAGDDAGLHRELGAGYKRMADIQGLDTTGSLGDVEGAVVSAERAIAHWQDAIALEPDTRSRIRLASGHRTLADIEVKRGRFDQARESYTAARRISAEVAEVDPTDVRARRQLAIVATKLGDLLSRRSDVDAARVEYEVALDWTGKLARELPADLDLQRDHLIALGRLGRLAVEAGEIDHARSLLARSLDLALDLTLANPDNAQLRADLSVAHERLGDLELSEDRVDAALVHHEAAEAITRVLAEADPLNRMRQQNLSISIEKIAGVLMRNDRPDEALVRYQQSLAMTSELSALDPTNVTTRFNVAICEMNVAVAQRSAGQPVAAAATYGHMLAICRDLLESDMDTPNYFVGFTIALVGLAEIGLETGSLDGTIATLEATQRLGRQVVDRHPEAAWAREHFAEICRHLAMCYERRGGERNHSGDVVLACSLYQVAKEQATAMGDDGSSASLGEDIARCRGALMGMSGWDPAD